MEESLEELLKEVQEADIRWAQRVKEGANLEEKPQILNIGPLPRKITVRTEIEQPKYSIFPLPNVNKSRGGKIYLAKKQLKIKNHQLTYEADELQRKLLSDQIDKLVETVRALQKEKRKRIKKNKKNVKLV